MVIKSTINNEMHVSSSSVEQDYDNIEHQQLYDYVNTMLRSRIFIGSFQEKRYVANLKEYRDVIVVDSDENDLQEDLDTVKRRLSNVFKDKWIGITTPRTIGAPVGYCVWVDLPKEVFGTYWYKIRSVSFRENEVLLKVKPIRAVNLKCKCNAIESTSQSNVIPNFLQNELKVHKKFPRITWENTKETLKFLFILTGTIIMGLIGGAKYLMEFGLKLTHESSNLIKALTPFAIACVRACEKVIGGFYILLAMIIRDIRGPNTVRKIIIPNQPMITYRTQPLNRYGRQATITEL